MEFNRNELKIINNLRFYRILSYASMIFGAIGIPFGLYSLFFSYEKHRLNISLIAASAVVLAMGYLMWMFLGIIKKYNEKFHITSASTRSAKGG